jgi:AraC-like DNA-binding protein
VLATNTVLRGDGVEVLDVACRHPAGRGQPGEQTTGHALVFVRRGCFARSADGTKALLDPTVAFCMTPGQEQRYDHPHDHGDDCTALFFDPGLIASIWGGDPGLPAGPLPITPSIDLEHRLLLASARRGGDPHDLLERAITLAACALELADRSRVAAGRPATVRARAAIVDSARELLAAEPDRALSDLARALSVSPHHLSRIFSTATGHTVSRHRMKLRVRHALDRLAGGENDLARIAADTGFADQSHLCRVVHQETGHTPSVLRQALA